MPDDFYLVGYADYITAVIIARNTDLTRSKLTKVLLRTQTWLDSHSVSLATKKTELILLTRKHIPLGMNMQVHSETIQTTETLKYLDIRMDNKLTYCAQIQHAVKKIRQHNHATIKSYGKYWKAARL